MDGDGLAYKRTAGHPPNSRPAMQPKPTTQQKVYNTDARHVETIYKNKGSARQPLDHHSASKRKPVTQQIHRPGVLDFDVPNLAGKKRQAEEDLPEKDPKKGKVRAV